jgi:hypothetical protein
VATCKCSQLCAVTTCQYTPVVSYQHLLTIIIDSIGDHRRSCAGCAPPPSSSSPPPPPAPPPPLPQCSPSPPPSHDSHDRADLRGAWHVGRQSCRAFFLGAGGPLALVSLRLRHGRPLGCAGTGTTGVKPSSATRTSRATCSSGSSSDDGGDGSSAPATLASRSAAACAFCSIACCFSVAPPPTRQRNATLLRRRA